MSRRLCRRAHRINHVGTTASPHRAHTRETTKHITKINASCCAIADDGDDEKVRLSCVRGRWNRGKKLLDIFSAARKINESFMCFCACPAVDDGSDSETNANTTNVLHISVFSVGGKNSNTIWNFHNYILFTTVQNVLSVTVHTHYTANNELYANPVYITICIRTMRSVRGYN